MMIAEFVAFIAVFMLLTVYLRNRRLREEKSLQKQGLRDIQQIKKLISLVQTHRGLSGAMLSGNTDVATDLSKKQEDIIRLVGDINRGEVKNFGRWQTFEVQWHDLATTGQTNSLMSNFEQHTLLIKNLAWMLEDVAEQCHLTTDFLPEFTNLGFVWRELLQSAESIGQCRAIGTGVAVRKSCSSVDKIRLSYQIKVIKDVTDNTLRNLPCLPQERACHEKLIQEATCDLNKLIKMICDNLITQSRVTIDSLDYFNLATEAMKAMYQIFDHQVKQVSRML